MKTGPQLIVDHMVLYQILLDKQFWTRCPELAELREEGARYRQLILDEALNAKPNCGSCSTLTAVIRPYQLQFTQKLAALFQADAYNTESFVNYIASKRGYRPVPIIVYTKDPVGGQSLKLTL